MLLEYWLVPIFLSACSQDTPVHEISIEERKLAIVPEGMRLVHGTFNPLGVNVALTIQRGEKYSVLLGKNTSDLYDWVGTPTFDTEGKTFTYVAARQHRYFVVVNGQIGEMFDAVDNPVFDRGKCIAYRAGINGKYCVVIGLRKDAEYDSVDNITANPENSQIAYSARIGQHCFIVLDGKAHAKYDWVGKPVFDRSGVRLAYC